MSRLPVTTQRASKLIAIASIASSWPDGTRATTVESLESTVLTAIVNYQLTPKYTLQFIQSYDFGERERVLSRWSLIRQFDRWYASITVRVDYLADDSGIFFNLWPEGFGIAGGTERLEAFGK